MALTELMSYAPTMAAMQQPQGLAGILQQQATQPLMQPIPQVQEPKPSAFAKGGKGWEIVGILGDALATAGGGQATYGPMMAEQRQLEEKGRQKLAELMAQIEQRKADRAAALEDRKTIIDYQRDNPAPDSFQKALMLAGIDPDSDEARNLARKRAEMLTNPVQLVPDGMGGYAAVRPNEAASGLPQGYDPSEWELVPGDAGGNASGGF